MTSIMEPFSDLEGTRGIAVILTVKTQWLGSDKGEAEKGTYAECVPGLYV